MSLTKSIVMSLIKSFVMSLIKNLFIRNAMSTAVSIICKLTRVRKCLYLVAA